jgi:Lrp/AsnC family transcriptional regulator for asnA, asnC and gidA
MVLDKRDLKIISELILDCRQSDIALSKKIGLNRRTTSKRIKALEKKGIIKSYTILIDYPRLGYKMHFLFWIKADPPLFKYIMEEIEKYERIHRVSIVTGDFDLVVAGSFENQKQLDTFLMNKLWKTQGIKSIKSDLILNYYFKKEPIYDSKRKRPVKITDLEKKIMNQLRQNARMTNEDIANALKVPRHKVVYQLNRLVKLGIIRRFTIVVDYWKLGLPILTYIHLSVDPKKLNEALKKILTLKKIDWVNEGTSTVGFYLRGAFKNRAELRKFIYTKISSLPGIQSIQIYQVIEERGKHYV